jgi:hypothetical protein
MDRRVLPSNLIYKLLHHHHRRRQRRIHHHRHRPPPKDQFLLNQVELSKGKFPCL